MLEHIKARQMPEKSWIGISTAANPSPQLSITHASARCTLRSVYQAPVVATHIPVVRKAASSMCGQRTRMIEPVVMVHQSAGIILPSMIVCPSGTCIQLLLARIQNEENIVPSESRQQANR